MRRFSTMGLFIAVILAIRSFTSGTLQMWLLAAVFTAWAVFMAAPLLKKLKKRKLVRNPKLKVKKPKPDISVPATLETTLMRQVNSRITERLKPYYPNSNWEWVEANPVELVRDGGIGRIRIFDVESYNFVDVIFDRRGNINFNMVRIVPLEKTPDETTTVTVNTPESAIDVSVWYSIIGKTVLNDLIIELNSQGHNSLYIKENGDVVVQRDSTEVVKDTLDNLPSKNHWQELVQVFSLNGLTASHGSDCIALSW